MSLIDSENDKLIFDDIIQIVKDLFEVRDGSIPLNAADIAKSIVIDINSTSQDIIAIPLSFEDFVRVASRQPSPLDHRSTGELGLSSTLELKSSSILSICRDRRDGYRLPFNPTYEWQKIEPWQEPLPWKGLEIQLESKQARISESTQAVLMIPSLDRPVRIWAKRTDTVKILYDKISDEWPGLRGRNAIIPPPSSIRLIYQSRPLDENSTVEDIGLFFIAKDLTVEVVDFLLTPSKALPPPPDQTTIFDISDDSHNPAGACNNRWLCLNV